jgi:O-antigen/teichoic acid export membrane protein
VLATFSAAPAFTAILLLSLSAATGGVLLSKALWRYEPWNLRGAPGVLRDIATVGAWTTAGSAIHWTFTQGYNYLIVGTLDVRAVAAVAATRLLMMPVNMLSTGVGSTMFPTTSNWLLQHRPGKVFLRLILLSCGLTALAICYFVVIWWLRDWIFLRVLKKHFAHRDLLVMLWFVIFILMVFRDQLIFLPLARGRFRILTWMTLASAVLSLTVSYLAMVRIGVAGALIGVMVGEVTSVIGITVLSLLEVRGSAGNPALA